MTTATATANATDTQALINALLAQVASLSKQLETTTLKTVPHPVGKQSTVEKLETPLPVHSEVEVIKGMQKNSKAVDNAEVADVTAGKPKAARKPKASPVLREQLIDDVLNGRDRFGNLTYREAQKLCGLVGLKANGSHDLLTQRWTAYVKKTVTPEMLKSTKSSVKRDYQGLSYRQAQRLVKWYKENIPAPTADFVKNIGWDNVEQNCDAVLECESFWKLVNNDEHADNLNEFIGSEFIVNAD